MDAAAVIEYITETFDGLDVVTANADSFFFYDPGQTLPVDRRLPFATLVTSDAYDSVSQLNRDGVYRLNVGVDKDTYAATFGAHPRPAGPSGVVDTGHDYATLDEIMPHPVYATMSWVCVLNPSAATFERVKPLLAEAYALGVRRHARRAARA